MNHSPNHSSPKSTPEGSTEPNALWQEAKQAVSQVADQAGEKLKSEIDTKKGLAADKASEVASKLRDTKHALKDVGPLPDLADQAADQIERLADYVQSRNLGDLVREVERFARREPAIFLGASFAVGLLGGRFLKSSSRRPSTMSGERLELADDDPGMSSELRRLTDSFEPTPMRTASSPSSSTSSSTSKQSSSMGFSSLSSTPRTPPTSTPLPPVPPPMMERRITQPMAPLKTEASTGSTTPTPPSFLDGTGKSNGKNGTS